MDMRVAVAKPLKDGQKGRVNVTPERKLILAGWKFSAAKNNLPRKKKFFNKMVRLFQSLDQITVAEEDGITSYFLRMMDLAKEQGFGIEVRLRAPKRAKLPRKKVKGAHLKP